MAKGPARSAQLSQQPHTPTGDCPPLSLIWTFHKRNRVSPHWQLQLIYTRALVVLRVIDFNCLQFTFQLAKRHVRASSSRTNNKNTRALMSCQQRRTISHESECFAVCATWMALKCARAAPNFPLCCRRPDRISKRVCSYTPQNMKGIPWPKLGRIWLR
jgi:hypothetical protein